jgi:hypothetical protein
MVKVVVDELVSSAGLDPTRRQDESKAGARIGEMTGTTCCALGVLSGMPGALLIFLNVSAQHAAETAIFCACVAGGIVMVPSGICEAEILGFASKNLDLEGYRPVASGQARNADNGKTRASFLRSSRISKLGGEALKEVRHGCGSLGEEVPLVVAGDRAVVDGTDSEFGRNCGAQ